MSGDRSAILTYHSLDVSGSVISTDPALFERQMGYLADSRIPVLPLDQVLDHPGSVAITFDDGYCNLLNYALPVLERYRLPATIFTVSQYCGLSNEWPSQPRGRVPVFPLLGWEELAALPSMFSLGAHTKTHPDLCRLPAEECEREMRECREEIQQRTGRAVRWFAYPYGISSPQVRALAGRHFDLAVGTSLRLLSSPLDRLDLPRIDAYYLGGRFSLEQLFSGPGRMYIGLRSLLRELRRLAGQ